MLTDGEIDLGSCTGLQTLILVASPEFSMDTDGNFITKLLASWKPRHLESMLVLMFYMEDEAVREVFSEVLRGIGPITEAWLKALEEPPSHTGQILDHQHVKCQLWVIVWDRKTEEKRWVEHSKNCFPTWVKLGQIRFILHKREHTFRR